MVFQRYIIYLFSRSCIKTKDEDNEIDFASFTQHPKDLHHCEFVVVQTMNQVKQLLWPPADGAKELTFFSENEQMLQVEFFRFSMFFFVVTISPKNYFK